MPSSDPASEVELLRSAVAKYFPIYDVKVSYEAVSMLVNANTATVEQSFDDLRRDLKAKRFITFINYSGGEYKITIVRMPEVKPKSVWINRVLLVVTFFTTTIAGMLLWADYSRSVEMFTLENFTLGALTFAVPLMAILGVHEYSHYLMSKRHGLEASLPFFIPSVPPFGTFGAFISMRDPMPSRKALVDIGAAGPLGGLLVTMPVALVGLYLTSLGQPIVGPIGEEGGMAVIIQPLYQLLSLLIPLPENVPLHPTAFAAWVGFLVTAINLLPVGQLDGGHIARGLFGEKAKYLSYIAGGALIVMALFYQGWLLFALLVLLLGLRHPAPLNDISRLSRRTKAIGALALIILAVTFVPTPLVTITPDHSFDLSVAGGNNTTVVPGGVATFHIWVNNTGNTNSVVSVTLNDTPGDWAAAVYLSNGTSENITNRLTFPLGYENSTEVVVRLQLSPTTTVTEKDLQLHVQANDVSKDLTLTVRTA